MLNLVSALNKAPNMGWSQCSLNKHLVGNSRNSSTVDNVNRKATIPKHNIVKKCRKTKAKRTL